jgi:hypothetical protein
MVSDQQGRTKNITQVSKLSTAENMANAGRERNR